MKRLQSFWFWALVVLFYGALRVHAQAVEPSSASKVMAVGPLVHSSHYIDDVPGGTSPNGDGDGRAESGEHVGLAVFLFNQGNQTAVGVESTTLTCSDPDVTVLDQLNCWPDIPGGQTKENTCNYEFSVNSNLAQDKSVTFWMTITAQNGGPWTSSFSVSIYRQGASLAAPSNLTASIYSSTAIFLGWSDNSSDEDGFKIERRVGTSGSYSEIATVGANVRTYIDGGRTVGVYYYYRVRAYAGSNYSSYSNEFGILFWLPNLTVGPLVYSSHFIDDVPGGTSTNGDGDGRAENNEHVALAVTLLNQGNQTAVGVESVSLSCSDPDVTVLDQENCWPDIPGGQTKENACNYEFHVNSNLTQDKTVPFSMTVKAQNGGPWTSTFLVQLKLQDYITAPSNLSASALNSNTARLSWSWQDNSPSEQGFKIERRTSAGNYNEIATVGLNVTTYDDGGLTSGTYFYRVRSYVGSVYSTYSNEVSVTVSPTPSDLVADRVYLRSAPSGGGSEVDNPLPGQQYYVSLEYRNVGAGTTGNFRWEVKINGNMVCFFDESVVGNSNWVRNCANPIIWPCPSPGASNTLQAVLDVNNSVAENNENNNSVSRTYVCPSLCQLTWKVDMTLQDAGNNSALLSFGLGTTATDDIDVACGEAELPPAPPSGIFDARFELPVSPPKASLKDYRNSSQQTVTWRVKFQPGVNGSMTFSWNPANFPAGSVSLKDEIIGTLVNVNMKAQSSYTLNNPGISSLKIEYRTIDCKDITVITGWNVVSVPLLATDMAVSTLFPDAASQAFAFNNGYTPATTLTVGKGYWIKFNAAKTYNICGIPVTPKRIPVIAGWNIIGPFETDVPVANITSSPANIIASAYFGYNNGYTQATTLSVGKGYWVKASAAGELILPGSAMAKQATETNATRMAPQQEVNSAWPMLVLADSKSNSRRIYLAPAAEISADFEMPPVPPVGIFDVRFSSGRYVETLENGALEIQINSASYPIRIKAHNLGDRALNVKDALGGNALHEALTSGKEIIVSKAIDKVMVETAIQLPSRYALSQNYPNPFNPATMIRFAIPEKGHVKLTVYNIVGEKVAELVNQELPSGYHQVEFNGKTFASGLYFYVMESGSFRDLKKMVVAQ